MMTGTYFSPGPRLDIQGAQWEIEGETETHDPLHSLNLGSRAKGQLFSVCP